MIVRPIDLLSRQPHELYELDHQSTRRGRPLIKQRFVSYSPSCGARQRHQGSHEPRNVEIQEDLSGSSVPNSHESCKCSVSGWRTPIVRGMLKDVKNRLTT
jgi:hypothetical protein